MTKPKPRIGKSGRRLAQCLHARVKLTPSNVVGSRKDDHASFGISGNAVSMIIADDYFCFARRQLPTLIKFLRRAERELAQRAFAAAIRYATEEGLRERRRITP